MSDSGGDIDSNRFIRALLSLPNESNRIRIYQEVLCSYHRNCGARIGAPQVWFSFQELGDLISKRFEEAQAEAATRPREFPTIVQIQLQSVTQTFEEVAEPAHIKKKRKLCNEP
jgi:hypothetical protein